MNTNTTAFVRNRRRCLSSSMRESVSTAELRRWNATGRSSAWRISRDSSDLSMLRTAWRSTLCRAPPQHRLEGEEEQQSADQDVEGRGAPVRHHLVDDDQEHQRIDEPEQADEERRGDERAELRLVAQHVPGDRTQREPFVGHFLRRRKERRLVVTGFHESRSRNGASVSGPGLEQPGAVVVHRRHQDEPPVPAAHQHRSPGMAQIRGTHGTAVDGQPGAPAAGHGGIEVEGALAGKGFAEVFAVDADVPLPAQVRQAGKSRRQGGIRVRPCRRRQVSPVRTGGSDRSGPAQPGRRSTGTGLSHGPGRTQCRTSA